MDSLATAPLTLKIAVAGRDGSTINEHFGQADGFLIYDVDESGARLQERREIASHAQGDEDRRDTIRRMLGDCRALLVQRVGEAPKEMMAKVGVDANALYAGKPVLDSLLAYYTDHANDAPQAILSEPEPEPEPLADPANFRILHTMFRVSDLERSLDFYTRLLGMKVLEQREHKKNQFSQAYLAFNDAPDQAALELVMNWNRAEPYPQGEAFGHIAIGVQSIGALCRMLEAEGIPMPRPPRSQKHGSTIVAFIEDPDGYYIELVQPTAA